MAVAVTHMTSIYANMKVGGWDITDLVKDPSSEEFSRFLRSIEEQLVQFEQSRQLLRQEISPEEFDKRKGEWLPSIEDREYVRSLMHPVTEPGKIANWIAPPATGIKGKPFEFEYVRL